KELGEFPRRRHFVTGRDNRVVEGNRHDVLLSPGSPAQIGAGTNCLRRARRRARWPEPLAGAPSADPFAPPTALALGRPLASGPLVGWVRLGRLPPSLP